MIEIRKCQFAEIEQAHNFATLQAEYAEESSIAEIGLPTAQCEIYRCMEEAGILHVIGAFQGGELVGFLLFLMSIYPHYGKPIASGESFFVTKEARKGGTGIKLLREAESLAAILGAKGLFMSAPVGGRLERVLPGVGYQHTNQVFFKVLK